MKQFLFLLFALPWLLWAADKPAALGGYRYDVRVLRADVIAKKGIANVDFSGKMLAPADFSKYSIVYYGELLKSPAVPVWSNENIRHLRNYLNQGGVIIFSGESGKVFFGKSAALVKEILGITKFTKLKNVSHIRYEDQDLLWHEGSYCAAAGVTDAQVLGNFVLKDGRTFPALTVKRFANGGAVYWIAPSLNRLKVNFSRQKKSLGEADEDGRFIATPEGIAVDQLTGLYIKLFSSVNVATAHKKSSWGDKPIGTPGTLVLPKTFKNRPQLKHGKPVYKDGITLCRGGEMAVIYAPAGSKVLKRLASEIKYHLDIITGKKFTVTSKYPGQETSAVILGGAAEAGKFGIDFNKLRRDTAVLKTQGKHLLICGRNGGASYATTVFLESLGCRYLWPGKDGKVIPRSKELIAKDIPLNFVPALQIRNIREMSFFNPRWADSIRKFNFTSDEMDVLYRRHAKDHPGNRGFLQWHGVNDASSSYGWERNPKHRFEWGHAFNDYYKLYGKKHPEFFGLQPDGNRSKQAHRPTFCLSNDKFADLVAANTVAKFKVQPDKQALSICLNDGGHSSPCLCAECRKLDPVNAPRHGMLLFYPTRRTLDYVSLTDRVLDFSNRVAEKVTKVLPDKQLTFYAYANYVHPPVKVKPHKSLIILCVAGNYDNVKTHRSQFASFAAWSTLNNPLLWRPNVLYTGRKFVAPVNYGRKLFNDLEMLKVNRVIGTDFDGLNYAWACNAWVVYAVSKAHWNFEQLDYDTVIDDFCRSGFGKAADAVAGYLKLLEQLSDSSAEKGGDYIEMFDAENLGKLEKYLKKAETLAAGDDAVLRRIAFLQVAMKHLKAQRALWDAKKANHPDYAKMRQAFFKTIHDDCVKNPLTVNPLMTGFYNFAK
ncbi:MAG: DUF4838 domain-containing protein [Lentisphaeria bacterium]|nr:DUF4838 domain-containing protein [Lentisphaeria bacterium]